MNPISMIIATMAPASSAHERLVMVALALHSGADGRCGLSQDEIANWGISDSGTISKTLRAMEISGRVRITLKGADPKFPGSGSGRSWIELVASQGEWDFIRETGVGNIAQTQSPVRVSRDSRDDINNLYSGDIPGAGARPIAELAEAIWAITPEQCRKGSSQQRVMFALRDAKAAGHDLGQIVRDVAGYYQIPCKAEDMRFKGAPQRVIEQRKWETVGEVRPPPAMPHSPPQDAPRGDDRPVAIQLPDGARITPPPGAQTDEVGTMENPGWRRQVSWLQDHYSRPANIRDGFWPEHKRGPLPGAPGSRVWPVLVIHFSKGDHP